MGWEWLNRMHLLMLLYVFPYIFLKGTLVNLRKHPYFAQNSSNSHPLSKYKGYSRSSIFFLMLLLKTLVSFLRDLLIKDKPYRVFITLNYIICKLIHWPRLLHLLHRKISDLLLDVLFWFQYLVLIYHLVEINI